MENCLNIQKSLGWCQGTPVLPGVRRRLYYLSKSAILKWPTLPRDENGRATSAELTGDFVLAADAEVEIHRPPSRQSATHQRAARGSTQPDPTQQVDGRTPGRRGRGTIGREPAYINNNDNAFLVQDMADNWRLVGLPERWQTKSTVSQDLGQGPTGTTSTTVSVEARR